MKPNWFVICRSPSALPSVGLSLGNNERNSCMKTDHSLFPPLCYCWIYKTIWNAVCQMKQRSFNKIFSAHFVRKDDNNHAGMMETFHNTKRSLKVEVQLAIKLIHWRWSTLIFWRKKKAFKPKTWRTSSKSPVYITKRGWSRYSFEDKSEVWTSCLLLSLTILITWPQIRHKKTHARVDKLSEPRSVLISLQIIVLTKNIHGKLSAWCQGK